MRAPLGISVLLIAVVSLVPTTAAQDRQSFTGVITDSECADGYHGRMRMGDTDAECVRACIESHGGTYILSDGMAAYELSDQKSAAAFAAQRVTVTGTLDARTRTITVNSIVAAR
jgi:hypothetical protein